MHSEDPVAESAERAMAIYRDARPPDVDAELYAPGAVQRGHNPVREREMRGGMVTRLVLDPTGRADRGGESR